MTIRLHAIVSEYMKVVPTYEDTTASEVLTSWRYRDSRGRETSVIDTLCH